MGCYITISKYTQYTRNVKKISQIKSKALMPNQILKYNSILLGKRTTLKKKHFDVQYV